MQRKYFLAVLYAILVTATTPALSIADDIRLLPISASLTKETTSFQIKHAFPFRLPDNLPAGANFRGLIGSVSTVTVQKAGETKPAFSETLMGIDYILNDSCPVPGQPVNSYTELGNLFPNQPLAIYIMKQAMAGKETLKVDFTLPVGIPIRPGSCLMVTFDGTDFAGQPYTMTSDLAMRYDTTPIIGKAPYTTYLGVELVTGFNIGYRVAPVIKPGTVRAVYGDASATSSHGFGFEQQAGDWSVRFVVAVLTNGYCEKVFPHNTRAIDPHFPDAAFAYNGGYLDVPVVLQPEAVKLADATVKGSGVSSGQVNTTGLPNLAVHVVPGDCLVEASIPGGAIARVGGGINTEMQTLIEIVPD